jgi:hypothetical protein
MIKNYLILFVLLFSTYIGIAQTANIGSPYMDVQGPLYLRDHAYSLNKAGNGWVMWGVRNTAGSETKIDFNNISSVNSTGGNLGIGLLTPSTKLHVVGEGTFGNNGFGTLRLGTDDGTNLWIRNITNDRTLRFNTSNTTFDMRTNGEFEWTSLGTLRMRVGSQTLGSTAGNYAMVNQIASSGGSGGNTIVNSNWLLRDATGSDWQTARLHNAISIDGSYGTPGVNTATWWERDPQGNIQSWGNGASTYMTIKSGAVGIGTTDPDELLTVKGKIHTQEVRVDLTGAVTPDYVFEKDYNLIPLSEVESYINANKHLPEVPSAKEMEANGMNLKEMNLILLKKVEELTLYLIEIKKENDRLKQQDRIIIEKMEIMSKQIRP